MEKKELIFYPENPVTRFLFNDTRSAAIWLVVRIYVGWIWLQSGIHKVFDDAWTGKNAGGGSQRIFTRCHRKSIHDE